MVQALPVRPERVEGPGRFQRFYRLFLLRLFHEGLGQPEAPARARPRRLARQGPVPERRPVRPARAGARKPRTSSSPTRPSSGSSTFSTATAGTWTSGHTGRTTRSTPTYSATSSRSTSTRSRWGRTTPRRTSPATSRGTRLSPSCSTRPGRSAPSPSGRTAASGGSLQEDPDRYIYPAVGHGIAWNARQPEAPVRLDQSITSFPRTGEGDSPQRAQRTQRGKKR